MASLFSAMHMALYPRFGPDAEIPRLTSPGETHIMIKYFRPCSIVTLLLFMKSMIGLFYLFGTENSLWTAHDPEILI